MRRSAWALLAASLLAACSGSTAGVPATRSYNATASVGDFMLITIHSDTHTIEYDNRTTSETGTVSYTVNADGTYQITTPGSKITTAYELPGLALVMKGTNMGTSGTEQTLIVGVLKAPISIASVAGKSYTIMQFRTKDGGFEVGHVDIDGAGDVTLSEYIPAWVAYGHTPEAGSLAGYSNRSVAGMLTDDATTGTILANPEGVPQRVFGTPGGYFAVDSDNGSIFGIQEAAASAFPAGAAGAYKALVYQKHDVYTDAGAETGTGEVVLADVTIAPAGAGWQITVAPEGGTPFTRALTPFDTSAYHGTGKVTSQCNGLFVFDDSSGTTVFVNVMDRSLAFGSFSYTGSGTGPTGAQYSYLYGFALKTP